MHINLGEINRDRFNVEDRFIEGYGPVVLVCSNKTTHDWQYDELHLRSLLCDPDGEIISSGFKKFFNYGEREDLDAITADLIENGTVYYPNKMDGSLIVRDVLHPKDGSDPFVHFRTRGSHHLGDFHTPVMSMMKERYPRVFDTMYDQSISALFEYTSPNNRIILKYEEAELTLLGGMKRSRNVPYFVWATPDLNLEIAGELGVNALVFHDLPSDPKELVKIVKAWPDAEGIVAWCETGDMIGYDGVEHVIHMAKIKAWDYIRLHSLKYAFSGKKLRKMCYAAGIEDIEALRAALFAFGVDWETLTLFRPDFEEYINERNARKEHILKFIEAYSLTGLKGACSRKDIALQSKQYCKDQGEPKMFSVCMAFAFDNTDKMNRMIDAYSLGITATGLSIYREQGQSLFDGLKPFMEVFEERMEMMTEGSDADD
jgi:hypothetical protein